MGETAKRKKSKRQREEYDKEKREDGNKLVKSCEEDETKGESARRNREKKDGEGQRKKKGKKYRRGGRGK